jgi:hypothetical protein
MCKRVGTVCLRDIADPMARFSVHEVEVVAGWQHASHSEQNARAPESMCK